MEERLFVVIAAYNEGEAIAEVVEGLRQSGFRNVVVVDDGSSDLTGATALAKGATLLTHPINLGQGAALQSGIDYASKNGADYVVTFDADGQHEKDEILPMVAALRASGADIALGSRFLGRTENMPAMKKVTLKLAVFFTKISTRLPLTDAHNGLRVLGRNAMKVLRIRQNRMAHASEILNQIAEKKLKYIEFPVTVKYTVYSLQKGQKISNSLNIIRDLFFGGLYK